MSAEYTRTQLCTTFNISEKTLRYLETTQRITLTWAPVKGLLRTEVDEAAQLILACAKNHIDSFGVSGSKKLFPLLPFQRFLFLRYLQAPVGDIIFEVTNRNLLGRPLLYGPVIEKQQKAFINNLPKPLQTHIKNDKPFTEESKKQLATVLGICDIEMAYQRPELEQSFYFMSDAATKYTIDCFLATRSTLAEIAGALEDIVGMSVNPQGLLFYQMLFSDYSALSADDVRTYLKETRPSYRAIIQAGLGSTVAETRLRLGLADELDKEALILALKKKLAHEIMLTADAKSPEDKRSFALAFRNYMILVDRDDRFSKDTSKDNLPKTGGIFAAFRLEESNIDTQLFRLPGPSEVKSAKA